MLRMDVSSGVRGQRGDVCVRGSVYGRRPDVLVSSACNAAIMDGHGWRTGGRRLRASEVVAAALVWWLAGVHECE